MSHAATNPAAAVAVADHNGHHHDPHLAHHFDTPEQQYQSSKLGMWVFLATEILMFGGLFCAYSVYRHNHPEVFAFAHQALDPILGGINTLVLIASSFTMAWGVRAAQLNQRKTLVVCLAITLLGGAGFMGIKSIEYNTKWKHNLFPGTENVYSQGFTGEEKPPVDLEALMSGEGGEHAAAASPQAAHNPDAAAIAKAYATRMTIVDPNAGTPDAAKIKPNFATLPGLANQTMSAGGEHLLYTDLTRIDRKRVAVFFSCYFLMTGLHGIHVMVGMGLIFWILRRSLPPGARMFANAAGILVIGLFGVFLGWLVGVSWVLWLGVALGALGLLGSIAFIGRAMKATGEGEFSSRYFAPVDLVGLYWHLVDMIWIFLFPLLYLIH